MLDDLPLILIAAGPAAYGALAGADFGAGIWIPALSQPLRMRASRTRSVTVPMPRGAFSTTLCQAPPPAHEAASSPEAASSGRSQPNDRP
jgi:hypothetical protein